MDSEEDLDSVPQPTCTRLKEGFALKDFIQTSQTEFEIQPESDNEEEYKRLDSVFNFQEIEPFLNLECLGIDDDNNDNNPGVPFNKLHKKMKNVTPDGKIMKLVKNGGSGPVVPPDAAVYIHYSSYLENDEVPFDVSFLRNKNPVRFVLGHNSLIAGMEIAVRTMRKKEKSQFLIHPDLAYGKMGCPPRIPGDETVLIEIELIDFVDCGGADDLDPDSNMCDKKALFDVIKVVTANINLGNDLFENKNHKAAAYRYRRAVKLLHSVRLNSDEEEKEQKKLLMRAYVNLCVCYNKADYRHPQRVCATAAEAMRYCPEVAEQNVKLHFNWGRALLQLSDFERSLKHLNIALSLSPKCSEINKELAELEKKMEIYKETTKITCQRAFGNNPANICPEEEMLNIQTDFKDSLKKQLKSFIQSSNTQLGLPPGLTTFEEEACREIGKSMGLQVRLRGGPGKRNILFIKND